MPSPFQAELNVLVDEIYSLSMIYQISPRLVISRLEREIAEGTRDKTYQMRLMQL